MTVCSIRIFSKIIIHIFIYTFFLKKNTIHTKFPKINWFWTFATLITWQITFVFPFGTRNIFHSLLSSATAWATSFIRNTAKFRFIPTHPITTRTGRSEHDGDVAAGANVKKLRRERNFYFQRDAIRNCERDDESVAHAVCTTNSSFAFVPVTTKRGRVALLFHCQKGVSTLRWLDPRARLPSFLPPLPRILG